MRLSLAYNPVYAFTKIFGLKMSPRLRTRILLASIILCIYALVVIEINIVDIVRILFRHIASLEIVVGNVRHVVRWVHALIMEGVGQRSLHLISIRAINVIFDSALHTFDERLFSIELFTICVVLVHFFYLYLIE